VDLQSEKLGAPHPETPDGAHLHIAGKTEDGFRVIEVWDSREHIERFMDSGLAQALQEAQIPEPTITEFEVHKLDWVRG
jgi:quinol monooxygenase YgiN